MAKTSYLIIPDGYVDQFYSSVASKDRFQYARVVHINRLLSYKQQKKVRARSLLPGISLLWAALSSGERLAWGDAGAVVGKSGSRLFVQDTTRRMQSSIGGVATPSEIHQSLVGEITMAADTDHLKLVQEHPKNYWVQHKVTGKQKVYEAVKVTEDFVLPLDLTISYKTDLTAGGGDAYARYYAQVRSNYQGRTLTTNCTCELPLSSGWDVATATINSVVGIPIGYDLIIEVFGVTGSMYFDTIKAEHSGQNWCRDPWCDDIRQGFTRSFFQVAKHWAPSIITSGADYGSVYPAD